MQSEWLQNQVHPGNPAIFSIKTSPNSLCSLSVVDEATTFNSKENFNLKLILDYFMDEKLNAQDLSSSRMNCVKHIKKPPLGQTVQNEIFLDPNYFFLQKLTKDFLNILGARKENRLKATMPIQQLLLR